MKTELLPTLIDLHTHVLPGVDDGARDLDEALAMLVAAEADGIATVLATPHAHHVSAEQVLVGVDQLNAAARASGINVTVLPGHEIRATIDIADHLAAGAVLPLAGTRWVLLESFLLDDWPARYVVRAIERVMAAGYRAIVAHPERYPFAQRSPDSVADLVSSGALLQLNAGSLFLKPDHVERVAAERMLSACQVQLLASDAHNSRYRPPRLVAGLARVAELCGPVAAAQMTELPARILAGDEI